MKIVHALGWYFPDSVGGTEVYVAGLTRRLRAAGHDVTIVAPDARGASSGRHEDAPVHRYPIPARATRDEAQGRVVVRGADRLHAWLRDWRPDIFHIHSFVTGLGLFELEAARACGARTIATHHLPSLGYICRTGTLMQEGEQPCDGVCEPAKCAACVLRVRGASRRVAAAIGALPIPISHAFGRALPGRTGTTVGMAGSIADHQAMQRRLVDLTDRMVMLNETARRMMIANGVPSAHLVVNRLGVSHEGLATKPARRTTAPIRIGFLGRLHRTKGLDELARSVLQIPSSVHFTLDIHGPAPEATERALVRDVRQMLAGDPRVSFCGPVAHADVPAVLASFDVLCCPSIWFENGPTVALESYAVGTPVIGTRLGNLRELIDDGVNGRLVTAGDTADLARALMEVATTPALVDRWRAALPRTRTMAEIAAGYLALYGELMRERSVA